MENQNKSYDEAAKRLKMEYEDREKLLPQLRVRSRREYLAKRKEDKVQEVSHRLKLYKCNFLIKFRFLF